MNTQDGLWDLPECIALPAQGEVHIWQCSLDQSGAFVEQEQSLLSADERERAARYYFERDRRRFIVARAGLRRLLAAYTAQSPASLQFSYSAKGKPALRAAHTSLDAQLHFNLAHSSELAVYAFMCGHEPGIDLERIRPMEDMLSIGRQYFSERECAILATLSSNALQATFFSYWTRKEAYLKACGEGLALLTTQLDVAASTSQPIVVPDSQLSEVTWYIYDLQIAPDFCAALAVDIPAVDIVYK